MPGMFRRFRRKSEQWPLSDEFSGPDAIGTPAKPGDREDMRTPTLDGPMLDSRILEGPANATNHMGSTRLYHAPDDVGTISSSGAASPPPAIRGGTGGGVRSPVQNKGNESNAKINHSSSLEYAVSHDSGVGSSDSGSSTTRPYAQRQRSGSGNDFRPSQLRDRVSPPQSQLSPQTSHPLQQSNSSRRFLQPTSEDDGKEQLDEFDAPQDISEVPSSALNKQKPKNNIGTAIQDRVAVVTGCSSGIGLASCMALLNADWCVLGVDINMAPKELSESRVFHFYQTDVTSAEAPKFIFQAAKDRFNGRIDALVNCAGVVDTLKCVDTLDMDEWNWVMETNLTAPVRLMGAMVKVFEEQKAGGSIVNIGSYASISGGVGGVAHTASKHGLVGVTKNTAFRFKKSNFRCNIICPGAVRSNIRDSVDPAQTDFEAAEVFKTVRDAAHPEDLRLQPEQIASMVLYLASEASKGINGAVIPVDNGWSTI